MTRLTSWKRATLDEKAGELTALNKQLPRGFAASIERHWRSWQLVVHVPPLDPSRSRQIEEQNASAELEHIAKIQKAREAKVFNGS